MCMPERFNYGLVRLGRENTIATFGKINGQISEYQSWSIMAY